MVRNFVALRADLPDGAVVGDGPNQWTVLEEQAAEQNFVINHAPPPNAWIVGYFVSNTGWPEYPSGSIIATLGSDQQLVARLTYVDNAIVDDPPNALSTVPGRGWATEPHSVDGNGSVNIQIGLLAPDGNTIDQAISGSLYITILYEVYTPV